MNLEPVQATTADGVVLRGELAPGAAKVWLVLVHDVEGDLDDWRTLRTRLQPQGWNLLALDLRGHGGSDGEWRRARALLDVDLGVTLARRGGAEHVAIVAAGTAAVIALESVARAVDEPTAALADTLVLLSPGPLDGADPRTLRGEGLATLIIGGALDPAAGDADALRAASIGWTLGVTFATAQRGAVLIDGPFGAHVVDKLGAFVREQASSVGPGLARVRRAAAVETRNHPSS